MYESASYLSLLSFLLESFCENTTNFHFLSLELPVHNISTFERGKSKWQHKWWRDSLQNSILWRSHLQNCGLMKRFTQCPVNSIFSGLFSILSSQQNIKYSEPAVHPQFHYYASMKFESNYIPVLFPQTLCYFLLKSVLDNSSFQSTFFNLSVVTTSCHVFQNLPTWNL